MYNILTLNKIAKIGLNVFDDNYTCADECANPDAILVRSASMHEMELPESLLSIARAGAGVNNIPLDKCSEKGIVVFNTPGANANAVKELVIAGLFLSSRKVVPAIEWAKTLKGEGANVGKLVEKGKSQFAGPEIKGKKLGVIGLGAIGVLVANAAKNLGMTVYGYDPYLSVESAWSLSHHIIHSKSIKEIYENCDYITVHVPLMDATKHMINAEAIASMKDGVRILNFARDGLVNSDDMKAALASGKVAAYVVDFPTDEMLDVENVIAIPHLGASTPESEDNCAVMAANQTKDFIENGNIKNSVNLPAVNAGAVVHSRLCVVHKNIPHVITNISSKFSNLNINIENLISKSRGDYAYAIFDFDGQLNMDEINSIEGVVRTRLITK
ncbi:MAG: 3-phosphoglycerate dehydrogenase [Clostridia bacterium]|nr:3-phosphoglycerate dehydrogenase [Clostridia bacterium]